MKNHILKGIVAILTALLIPVTLCANAQPAVLDSQNTSSTSKPTEGFEEVLQNDNYILFFNSATADAALTDKKTGQTIYTTPIGKESDVLAAGGNINNLRSQVVVYYYKDKTVLSMNSFMDCLQQQGIEYEVANDTLSVTYNIGDTSFSANILPRAITKKRMEEKILSKLSEEDAQKVLNRYKLYSRDELDAEALKSIRLNFPGIDKDDLYIRAKIADYIAEDLWGLFESVGYTTEDLQIDCDEVGIENTYVEKAKFKITLEYNLTDDGFSVKMDPKKVEYLQEYKPFRIEILPFLCAADSSHEGFIFVPDGSGSIINFNNGKTSANGYWKDLFNHDAAITKDENLNDAQLSVLPVFALSSDDYGILATIDSGYESAGIAADISGKFNSYNYVYPFFGMVAVDEVSLTKQELDAFILMSEDLISTEIKVSYHLTKGGATYSDLALLYRDILKKNGTLPKTAKSDNSDLNIDFITSAYVTKRFLGIPYRTITSLTTYNQAAEILNGISDISADVTLVNALSGGINQSSNNKIKFLSCLGSKKERENLSSIANNLSVSYYAQRARNIKNSHRTKAINRSNINSFMYNIVSRYYEKTNVMRFLSSSKLTDYAKKINKSIAANNLSSVNILDLGYELNSDFNVKNQYDRVEARQEVEKYLETVSEKTRLTVDTGSYFSLKYASKIKNIPTTHSGYKINDYAVPFYQIVISGSIPYTVPSINQSHDMQTAFLKAVEIGAQLQCTWIYENADNIIDTREKYYGVLYEGSIEQIAGYARDYRDVYAKISKSAISEHKIYSETLTKTEYENGIAVYVNYGEKSASVDGIVVEPKDFYVKDGGNSVE